MFPKMLKHVLLKIKTYKNVSALTSQWTSVQTGPQYSVCSRLVFISALVFIIFDEKKHWHGIRILKHTETDWVVDTTNLIGDMDVD